MPSIYKVFNLNENFTLEELKKSYISLVDDLNKSNMTQIQKDLLTDQYKKLYKYGKELYKKNVDSDQEDQEYNNDIMTRSLYDRFDHFDNIFGLRPFSIQDPFVKFDKVFNQMRNKIDSYNQ